MFVELFETLDLKFPATYRSGSVGAPSWMETAAHVHHERITVRGEQAVRGAFIVLVS